MRTAECKTKLQNFFAHIILMFHTVVAGAQAFLNDTIPTVLQFVEGLKSVVNNPAMDIVTALIPSNIDNVIVEQLRAHLGTAIDMLKLELSCGADASLEDKLACYLDYLRNCSPELRSALYAKTAALLTKLHGGEDVLKYKDSEIDALVQIAYTKLKHDA